MAIKLIPEQAELKPTIPIVYGNVDYQELRAQLSRMDEILRTGKAEDTLVEKGLKEWIAKRKKAPSPRHQAKYQKLCRLAIRCNVARHLLGEDYRGMSMRLADSALLQWFCGIGGLDQVRVPSKSTIGRFAEWYDEADITWLSQQAVGAAAEASNPLELEETVDLEAAFLDSTCLKANIHFPVDWVLLRDATRTLMKAVACIRSQDLKHRMPEPMEFVTAMNKLSIEMSQTARKAGSKKEKKRILRVMKGMVKKVAAHARTYRALLLKRWKETQWSYAEAMKVVRRIDNVLEQLPAAKRQAHERIIGERQVKNSEKILSLYESEVNVIVRRKAEAEVEFGNGLLLAENPQGLILHWELHKETAPADSNQLIPTIEAIEEGYNQTVEVVGADRGFDSAANRKWLEERGTFNGTTPRDPERLSSRMAADEPFSEIQKRRGQTEGRIGIFKNKFLGRPPRAKGYEHRRLAVAWAALTHNLWVLARLPQKEAQEEAQNAPPIAQAA